VSNKPIENQTKLKEAIANAFGELKTVWYSKGIPECHMEAMTKIFNREYNIMKIREDIKHEYSEISKENSLVQKVMAAITKRENCLEKINELLANF
jgi:5'-deoxynucleotidase YfbR-like HD superfamily hydrolase